MSSENPPGPPLDVQLLGLEVTIVAVGHAVVRMQRSKLPAEQIEERKAGLERLRVEHDKLRARQRAESNDSEEAWKTSAARAT